MSLAHAQAFRDHVATDLPLQQACAAALQSGDTRRVRDEGAARGFVFTEAELQQCLAEGELSDSELELVAGGGQSGCQGGEPTKVTRS